VRWAVSASVAEYFSGWRPYRACKRLSNSRLSARGTFIVVRSLFTCLRDNGLPALRRCADLLRVGSLLQRSTIVVARRSCQWRRLAASAASVAPTARTYSMRPEEGAGRRKAFAKCPATSPTSAFRGQLTRRLLGTGRGSLCGPKKSICRISCASWILVIARSRARMISDLPRGSRLLRRSACSRASTIALAPSKRAPRTSSRSHLRPSSSRKISPRRGSSSGLVQGGPTVRNA
jgi:hypothetical protein